MRSTITKNYIFRWFECGLSIKQAADLCFKAESTIKGWDAGKPIPRECRLLMQLATAQRISPLIKGWDGWRFIDNKLVSPDGAHYTSNRIVELQFLITNDKQAMCPDNVRMIRERLNKARVSTP